jgi:hypothetical protein
MNKKYFQAFTIFQALNIIGLLFTCEIGFCKFTYRTGEIAHIPHKNTRVYSKENDKGMHLQYKTTSPDGKVISAKRHLLNDGKETYTGSKYIEKDKHFTKTPMTSKEAQEHIEKVRGF